MEFGLCYLNSHSSNGMKLQYVKIQRIACNRQSLPEISFCQAKREMRGRSFRTRGPFSVVRRVGLQGYLATAWFYFSPYFCLYYVYITGSEEFPEEFLMLPFCSIISQAKLDSINTASSECNISLKTLIPSFFSCLTNVPAHTLTARITPTK